MSSSRFRTIPEAVTALDGVVTWAEGANSPIGYFPALHREVALAIDAGVTADHFDDGARMVQMVGCFATRYLDAFDTFHRGDRPTQVWQVAFDRAADDSMTVLQHILMAMTAHIGLDLGVVAAEVAPGDELAGLRGDFERINGVLDGLVDMDRLAVDGVSPALRDLDRLGPVGDWLVEGAIHDAREHSWRLAVELAALEGDERDRAVAAADVRVAGFGRDVAHPTLLVRDFLRDVVRPAEGRAVASVIARLRVDPTTRGRGST